MKQRFVREGDNCIECINMPLYYGETSWYFCIKGNPKKADGIPYLILEDYNLFVTDNENKLIGMIIPTDKSCINSETIKTLSLRECFERYDKFEKTLAYFNNIVKQIEY